MQPPPAWNPELKNKKNIHTVPKSIQPISRYPAKSQCSNVQNSKCSKNIQEQSIDRYCQKLSGKGLTDKNQYVECDHGRHARGDKAWSKAEAVQSTASHCEAQSKQSASIATITAITAIKSGAFLSLAAAPDEWHGAVAI